MELVTLENGLRIICSPDEALRSVNVSVWVASGSRFENVNNMGISHFIEHMLFKGTHKRSAFEIAAQADEIGAHLNAYTTKEYTHYYIKALGHHLEKACDIIFDMLTSPLLNDTDIETERGVILEEIAMCDDDPSDVCFGLLEKTLMPKQSLGYEILGTKETVQSFTADDLRAHLNRYYVPERIVVGISGCFEKDEAERIITQHLGGMKNTGFPAEFSPVTLSTGFKVKKRSFEQTQLMLAFPAVGSDNKVRYPLQVLISVLGSSSSSRLNQRIREQLGLVYSIDAWLSQAIGSGFLGISLALTPQSEQKALEETCKVLREFSDSLTQKELDVAKEKVKSNLIMSRETPHSRLAANGYSQITRGEFVCDDDIIEAINSLTLEKARELSTQIIDSSKLCFVATGKVKEAEYYRSIIENAFRQ